jgi:hypothetical protein
MAALASVVLQRALRHSITHARGARRGGGEPRGPPPLLGSHGRPEGQPRGGGGSEKTSSSSPLPLPRHARLSHRGPEQRHDLRRGRALGVRSTSLERGVPVHPELWGRAVVTWSDRRL